MSIDCVLALVEGLLFYWGHLSQFQQQHFYLDAFKEKRVASCTFFKAWISFSYEAATTASIRFMR